MKKIVNFIYRYYPSLIVFSLFYFRVYEVNSSRTDFLDLAKHLLLLGYGLLVLLVVSRFIKPLSERANNMGDLFRANGTVTLGLIVLFSFVLVGDGQFPEFNFVMGLFLFYTAYLGFLLIERMSFQFRHPFLNTYKHIFFNGGLLLVLFIGMMTSDNRGIFSTEIQFAILFWLFVLKLIFSWVFDQWKLVKQLKNEKINAELMHLKSQVNPHFFFNTLNNLYGLVREKSDTAPDVVLKLSNLMRYTIYEGKKDQVDLESEIEYLQNFIELHKIRYHKPVDIQFEIKRDEHKYVITPLLFINLVENAFKHGVEHLTENAYIHIRLSAMFQSIHFTVENNFDPIEIDDSVGIGIENLKRRLELVYPGKHNLVTGVSRKAYHAQLDIQLS